MLWWVIHKLSAADSISCCLCLVMLITWATRLHRLPPNGRLYCDRCVAVNRKESGTSCQSFERCSVEMIQMLSLCWTSSLKNCWPVIRLTSKCDVDFRARLSWPTDDRKLADFYFLKATELRRSKKVREFVDKDAEASSIRSLLRAEPTPDLSAEAI